jgi:NADH:ubiquinone oxidoreductase subunit 2 (subunit N)
LSLLPFLAITSGAATAALLCRRLPRLSLSIGLLGLLAATIAALTIVPGDSLAVGSTGALEATDFGRLFLALGCGTGLLVALVGLATAWQRNLPPAILGGFAALGLALSIGDLIVALVAILAGALVGSLVTLVTPITPRDVRVATNEFRAIAVAGALALLGMAWIARPLGPLALEPVVFGFAYLAVAFAAAIRFGAIPFHLWAARLAGTAPEIALPLLLAWAPAGFAVVALAWVDRSIAPLLLPLEVERGLIVAIGVLSIVLGAGAAWFRDDLEHVVGYSIVQDAGFIILGMAVLTPAAWQPTRSWILVFVVAKTAFAAWAMAVRIRFGTRRIPELSGWARRSPVLGLGLLLVAVATIGAPGLLAWEVRGRLIELTVAEGPMRLLVTLGGLASLLYYGRLAVTGLRAPIPAVARVPGDLPRRRITTHFAAQPETRTVDAQAGALAAGRTRARVPTRIAASLGRLTGIGGRVEASVVGTWSANRAPVAAVCVLLLALIAGAVGAGGFGVGLAASADAPEPALPGASVTPTATQPVPTP